jgi:GTP-binding protein YchF
LQIGLVGMPYGGKTTFFNLLTGTEQRTGFNGNTEVHLGSAEVPDQRLDFLSKLFKPRKTTYAQIQFKDIPGVHSDNNLPAVTARLLDEVRSSDALVQVVRAFQSDTVSVVAGSPVPSKDLRDFQTEILLADISLVETRLKNIKEAKKTPKDALSQIAFLEKVLSALENEKPISSMNVSEDEQSTLAEYNFLSEKPVIFAINIDEPQLAEGNYPEREKIISYATENGNSFIEVCAQIEMEISQLQPEEREEFLKDLKLKSSGISRLARAAYKRLGLISFFTVGDDEVKAWTIRQGTTAQKAAGKIHSDIERGFIRAEVFHYNDLYEFGSPSTVKEKGLFRLEGKEYPVRDGDIISFRFNV